MADEREKEHNSYLLGKHLIDFSNTNLPKTHIFPIKTIADITFIELRAIPLLLNLLGMKYSEWVYGSKPNEPLDILEYLGREIDYEKSALELSANENFWDIFLSREDLNTYLKFEKVAYKDAFFITLGLSPNFSEHKKENMLNNRDMKLRLKLFESYGDIGLIDFFRKKRTDSPLELNLIFPENAENKEGAANTKKLLFCQAVKKALEQMEHTKEGIYDASNERWNKAQLIRYIFDQETNLFDDGKASYSQSSKDSIYKAINNVINNQKPEDFKNN